VRLPENPTTGFSWAVDENDRRLLALENTAYAPPVEAGFIGARGQRTFSFTARQLGDVALKLKYWRLWEGDASATERFAVNLRILE
jgi:predicted secreted protein